MEMNAVHGIYKGCIGTASSFGHVNGIRIRSRLATLRGSGYDPDSCECAYRLLTDTVLVD